MTLHVHFLQNHEISVPPQSFRAKHGWPLVIIMVETRVTCNCNGLGGVWWYVLASATCSTEPRQS